MYIFFVIAIVCSVAIAFPNKKEESEMREYFLEDESGIEADDGFSFQDANVGADEGFSLVADARPVEVSAM